MYTYIYMSYAYTIYIYMYIYMYMDMYVHMYILSFWMLCTNLSECDYLALFFNIIVLCSINVVSS